MKKSLLLFCCTLMLATSAISANLNVYASGLKITGIEDNKVSISYFLNAPADEVTFLLLDGANPNENSPVHSVSLSGKTAGANSAVIDLSGYVGSHYTWAIKATSNTANTEATLVGGGSSSDRRFNFYTPAGLAVDNNPNSPYFGRIYVTESRENVTTTSSRTVQQGVYIYGADLSDITNQGLNPYVGGVKWNENTTDRTNDFLNAMYGPARITIDDEGWVYICDNGPVSDKTSGVWRMNPANPSANFVDVLADASGNSQRGTLYQRINSAVVTGTAEQGKKLIVVDNKGDGSNNSKLIRFSLNATGTLLAGEKGTQLLNLYDNKIINAHNTIVRGAYDDLWIFQYRNIDNANYPGVLHINSTGTVDLSVGQQYNRRGSGAISPDGNWLAYCGLGTSVIRIVPISYDDNKTPTIDWENDIRISLANLDDGTNYVDGIAFDVAGNLYFASAINERLFAYALRKNDNTHTTIAPTNQQIRLSAPRIIAYDLRVDLVETGDFKFSFYANSLPEEGKLLFYRGGDRQNVVKEIPLTGLEKGENNIVIPNAEIPGYDQGKDLYWAVQLSGETIGQFGEVYQSDMLLTRGHAAIDNSPESDFFGRIYISNRIDNGIGEVYVLDKDCSPIYRGLCGMTKLQSVSRPAVDAEGYVYWSDFGDEHGGVWVTDPNSLNSTQPFFDGMQDPSGVWWKGSVALGSSCSGVFAYGSGANAKLFVMNEDQVNNQLPQYGYCVYNIGESGTMRRSWDKTPSKTVTVKGNAGQNFSIVGTSHGAFVCQNRTIRNNIESAISLQFYDNAGNQRYSSLGDARINGSFGAGMAVSSDEEQLAMVNGNGDILLFDITWNEDVPTLAYTTTYVTNFAAISTIHFDYAGNLVVMAGLGFAANGMTNDHRLVVYSQPTDNNTIIVPAPSSQRIPALILDEKKDNSTLLSAAAAQGETTNTVRVLRSLTSGMYNTLCLPFALNSLEGTCLEGAKVYKYTRSEKQGEDLYLHFTITKTSIIEAGVPYLVEPTMDIDVLDFTNVEISVTAVEIAGTRDANGVAFNGILAPKKLNANDKSVLFLISGNRLAWADETDSMYGFRGYFTVPSGASQIGARAFINTSESEMTALQQPTQQVEVTKFMHNGVLYIQRDGAIYTVMGTKVQ